MVDCGVIGRVARRKGCSPVHTAEDIAAAAAAAVGDAGGDGDADASQSRRQLVIAS